MIGISKLVLLAFSASPAAFAKTCRSRSSNNAVLGSSSTSSAAYVAPTTTLSTSSVSSQYIDAAAATTKSSTAAATTSATSSSSSTSGKPSLTPNGNKAGVAGGDSLKFTDMQSVLGWYYNWGPNPTASGSLATGSMCWGDGSSSDSQDASRLATFKSITPGTYKYVMGFNEPDFEGAGSSGVIDQTKAASEWDQWISPSGDDGSILISPSCAKQADETWLSGFLGNVTGNQPDALAVHIFVSTTAMFDTVLNHYLTKYTQPLWITEFACINYQVSPTVYCDQEQTNEIINYAVSQFESNSRVSAYAISDAYNGPVSALTSNGALSPTAQTYISAIKSAQAKTRRRHSNYRRSPRLH